MSKCSAVEFPVIFTDPNGRSPRLADRNNYNRDDNNGDYFRKRDRRDDYHDDRYNSRKCVENIDFFRPSRDDSLDLGILSFSFAFVFSFNNNRDHNNRDRRRSRSRSRDNRYNDEDSWSNNSR